MCIWEDACSAWLRLRTIGLRELVIVISLLRHELGHIGNIPLLRGVLWSGHLSRYRHLCSIDVILNALILIYDLLSKLILLLLEFLQFHLITLSLCEEQCIWSFLWFAAIVKNIGQIIKETIVIVNHNWIIWVRFLRWCIVLLKDWMTFICQSTNYV